MSYIGNEPIVSATRTITETTATAGQTVFVANGGYTVGYIDVFVNGAQLQTSDFTATNGSSITLDSPATIGDDIRLVAWGTFSAANLNGASLLDATVTPQKLAQKLTSGTAVASTSGTAIDFTGIPSWVRRITVMFNGVSTNGASVIQIQLGDSGGVETTGYLGSSGFIQNAGTSGTANFTSGFGITSAVNAASTYHGSMTITLLGSNQWVANGVFGRSDAAIPNFGYGSKTLSDTLDRVRITTVNGTDAFDAGSINILYE